jgi:hypothetical protein
MEGMARPGFVALRRNITEPLKPIRKLGALRVDELDPVNVRLSE